jgi:hypothetical protein
LVQWKSSAAAAASVSLSMVGFQQTANGIHFANFDMSGKPRNK